MTYIIVQKKDHNAVHAIFDSKERAERHLKEIIPQYVTKSFYSDKSLTASDFEIIERKPSTHKNGK